MTHAVQDRTPCVHGLISTSLVGNRSSPVRFVRSPAPWIASSSRQVLWRRNLQGSGTTGERHGLALPEGESCVPQSVLLSLAAPIPIEFGDQ